MSYFSANGIGHDRGANHTDLGEAKENLNEFDAVFQRVDHAVAGTRAEFEKGIGDAVRARVQLAPGELLRAEYQTGGIRP